MSLLDGLKAEIDKLNASIQKDETWVVNEITKGWQMLETAGHTMEVDIKGIFTYISTHQQSIVTSLHSALTALTFVAPFLGPGGAAVSAVQIALTAINAATAATNVLGSAVISGTTPLSTAVDAFHALKDAQTAVNAVVKQATSKPVVAA